MMIFRCIHIVELPLNANLVHFPCCVFVLFCNAYIFIHFYINCSRFVFRIREQAKNKHSKRFPVHGWRALDIWVNEMQIVRLKKKHTHSAVIILFSVKHLKKTATAFLTILLSQSWRIMHKKNFHIKIEISCIYIFSFYFSFSLQLHLCCTRSIRHCSLAQSVIKLHS